MREGSGSNTVIVSFVQGGVTGDAKMEGVQEKGAEGVLIVKKRRKGKESEARQGKARWGREREHVPVDTDFDRHVEVLFGGGGKECVGDEEEGEEKKEKKGDQRWKLLSNIPSSTRME